MSRPPVLQPLDQPACGGLAGKPKPNFQRNVYVGSAAVEALIGTLGSEAAAAVMAPIIVGATYDIANICDSPQPTDPGIDDQVLADALNPLVPGNWLTACERIRQWFLHYMWPQWCDCADGTTPPVAIASAPPLATLNPALPSGPPIDPCSTTSGQISPVVNNAQYVLMDSGGSPGLPINATSATLDFDVYPWFSGPIPPADVNLKILVYKQTTLSWEYSYGLPGQQFPWSISVEVPLDQYVTAIELQTQTSVTPNVAEVTWRVRAYCQNDLPGGTVQPCCPPDPLLDQRLAQVQQLVQAILTLMTSSNFALQDKTRHAGLSGTGSILLTTNPAAIRIDITSSLTGWPNNPGTPDYYYSLGFITTFAEQNPMKGIRLVYSGQVIPLSWMVDQIGWTLAPGVTIDLVELIPA